MSTTLESFNKHLETMSAKEEGFRVERAGFQERHTTLQAERDRLVQVRVRPPPPPPPLAPRARVGRRLHEMGCAESITQCMRPG